MMKWALYKCGGKLCAMKPIRRLCGVAPILAVAALAQAYIPPSQFILRNITNKRKDIRTIRVKSIVSVLEGDKTMPTRFTAYALYTAAAESLKAWATGDNGVRLYGIQRRGTLLPPVD